MSQIMHYFAMAGKTIQYGWPFFILFALIIAKIRWKNWPIDVVIIEKRGENFIKTNDRAGKYYDPYTGLTGYKMLFSKDTIPVVNFKWILHNSVNNTNLLERLINILRPTQGTLFLYKYGTKQYKPINIDDNTENSEIEFETVKDSSGNDVYVKKYQQYDPRGTLSALDFEVVDWDNMNFLVQEMRASFERRQKQNAWIKTVLIPITIMAVCGLVCIVMMKFSLDWSQSVPKPQNIQPQSPPQTTNPNLPDDFMPGK